MDDSTTNGAHRVLRMWVRPEMDAATVERTALTLVPGHGIDGDHSYDGRRHVTIIFQDDWAAALRDHGRDVDPQARRANVLVTGGNGQRFVGQTVRLGGALVEVKGIVNPCPVMDKASNGLQAALAPQGRGGVWGRIVEGATLRPGDELLPER
ncbi:MAG: MOSC domain-containing protein [Planctomycetes bacterium]|nr:MOSC domain-containing protein [Planctomycetota bacterium]